MTTPFPTKTSFTIAPIARDNDSSDEEETDESLEFDNPLEFDIGETSDEDDEGNFSDDYNENDESEDDFQPVIKELQQIAKLPRAVGKTFPTANKVTTPVVLPIPVPRANIPQPRVTQPQPQPQPQLKPVTLSVATAPQLSPLQLSVSTKPMVTQPILKPGAKKQQQTVQSIESILAKMPGINIKPVSNFVPANINDILSKESDETPMDFERRKRLTMTLSTIPQFRINNTTAVTAGLMLMKKSRLGITYDVEIEAALDYLLSLVQ